MKLNNKGFAISTIMYMILIMAIILISLSLVLLNNRKFILDGIKQSVKENIYSKCKLFSGDIDKEGSVLSCGTEFFYVMPNHELAGEDTISVLSKYNLNVGDNKYPNESTYGIQDSNAVAGFCEDDDCSNVYGWVPLSSVEIDNSLVEYVYGQQADIINGYLDEYKMYLENSVGLSDITVTLSSISQVENLGCSSSDFACKYDISGNIYNENVPEWLYSTSFWIGKDLMYIDYQGKFNSAYYDFSPEKYGPGSGHDPEYKTFYGVRPIVIIPISQISY